MKLPYRLMPSYLPSDMIDAINERASHEEERDAGIGLENDEKGNSLNANTNIRKSKVRWINYRNHQNFFIRQMIFDAVKEVNRNIFGFEIDYIQDIQHTTYIGDLDEPGHYNWHTDIFWDADTLYDRKVSFIAQLSDPSEYEGGEIELQCWKYPSPDPVQLKQKGSVLIFPSYMHHRVLPVTAGIRQSLVSWVEGPHFR